jgi:transcriptional regulator with XRE-family HTH domain
MKSKAAETRKSRRARTSSHQETYDLLLARLIKARQEAGLSQRDVCAAMGMPHSFLSKCETGERQIDVMEFLQLFKLYGKPLEYFLDE